MDTVRAEVAELTSLNDLKPMLASSSPCLSVYLPMSSAPANQAAKVNALEWRECLRTAQAKAEQMGPEATELLNSVSDFEAVAPSGEAKGKSIAVFRSREVFKTVWLHNSVAAKAVVGPHFCIRPMLPELVRDESFAVLALSQNDVRLLRCTHTSSEVVPLANGVPTSFEGYMNPAKPDHVSDNRSSPGPSSGTSKGVMFGTSTEREDKGEHLAHFYKQMDRAVNEALRETKESLVLVGVEYELSLYRSLSTYPKLVEEGVQGAPNSLKSGEMHARAIKAIDKHYENKVDAALAEYNHKAGGGASNRLEDIVPAAYDGRVLTLFIPDLREQVGKFDDSTYTTKGGEDGTPDAEDLVNAAAIQTILHAGQVFVLPDAKMPDGAPLAAVFRFNWGGAGTF
jgi:hypothetical protein